MIPTRVQLPFLSFLGTLQTLIHRVPGAVPGALESLRQVDSGLASEREACRFWCWHEEAQGDCKLGGHHSAPTVPTSSPKPSGLSQARHHSRHFLVTLLSPEEPWTLVIPPSWASASWCKQDAPPAALPLAGWPWAPEVTGGKSLPEAQASLSFPWGRGWSRKRHVEKTATVLCSSAPVDTAGRQQGTRACTAAAQLLTQLTPASLTAHVLWPGSERALRGFLIPHPGT